jgi:hypothetical protein
MTVSRSKPRPRVGGLMAPGSWGQVGDVVEVRWTARTGSLVVGEVVKVDDETVAVEDHDGKRWTAPRAEVSLKMATPRVTRHYRLHRARKRRMVIVRAVESSLITTEPMRAAIPSDRSTDMVEVVNTPLGPYVWIRRRAPKSEQRRWWSEQAKKLAVADAEVERFDVRTEAVAPGRYIPTRVEVENMLVLADEQLLAKDELERVLAWHQFWLEHPNADLGVVGPDGALIAREFRPYGRGAASAIELAAGTHEPGEGGDLGEAGDLAVAVEAELS